MSELEEMRAEIAELRARLEALETRAREDDERDEQHGRVMRSLRS